MQQRQAALNHIRDRLAKMQNAIKLDQAIKNYSLNGVAENYFRDVFNFIAAHCGEKSFLYGCHFENLNFTEPNAAHIDLVDKNKKFAFQITSTKTAEKIRNTLAAKNKPAYSDFNIKIFYLLGKPEAAEGTLTEGKLNKKNVNKLNDEFSLNVLDCLFDSTDLFREIENLDGCKLPELKEKYFTKPPEKVVHVYHNSQDFHVLSAKVKELQEQCHLHPGIPYFYEELKKAKENLATFERDVSALTEYFAKTPINTERLRLAKAAFEAGDYQAARKVLDEKLMREELEFLLDEDKRVDARKAEIKIARENKATEFVLKAQLTAIDYSLPDRIEQTIALFETALKSACKPYYLFSYARFLQDHSQFAASQLLYIEALTCFREIGDKQGEGATLNNLSQTYQARGDYATALDYLQQSLEITREICDKAGEGATLNNLSQIYDARGDYVTALDYLQQSLVIRREIGDKAGEGATLNNLGLITHATGDYASELDYLQQSLAIRREIGDKAGEGATLNNLSQIYDARGDYVTALDYLQQSLAIQREIGDQAGLCATLFNIGHIYWQNDEQREALQSWVAVYQIAQNIGAAQALNELEKLAGQLGLAGWEALAK